MAWYWCNLDVSGIPNRSRRGDPLDVHFEVLGYQEFVPMTEHMLGCAWIYPESLWLPVGFRGKAEVQRKMSMWRKAEANGGSKKEVQGRGKAGDH